jgi:hypothetical protein
VRCFEDVSEFSIPAKLGHVGDSQLISLDSWSFASTDLVSICIPKSVETLEGGVSIRFPDESRLRVLPPMALVGANLTDISFPASLGVSPMNQN